MTGSVHDVQSMGQEVCMVYSLCDGKCVCEKCAWCTVYVMGSVHGVQSM